MAFPSDGWVQIFLGGIELACFHCIDKFGDKIPVMDSWFIASYSVGQNVVWVSTVDSQQFWTYFHPKWILNMLQKTRSPSLQTLLKPTWSCEIFRTLPHKIPLLWLSVGPHSSISCHQYFNSMATITRGHLNWPSSMVVIFHQCSATFKFIDPSGDGCIRWATVPINICQTFMKVVCRLLF